MGYRSRAEFVAKAVRDKLIQVSAAIGNLVGYEHRHDDD